MQVCLGPIALVWVLIFLHLHSKESCCLEAIYEAVTETGVHEYLVGRTTGLSRSAPIPHPMPQSRKTFLIPRREHLMVPFPWDPLNIQVLCWFIIYKLSYEPVINSFLRLTLPIACEVH